MGQFKSSSSPSRNLFSWLKTVGIVGLVMLAGVSSQDQNGVPSAGTLCISECATCPVICSPPPPAHDHSHHSPSPQQQPPPAHHSPPPQSYYHSPSPPQPPTPVEPPPTPVEPPPTVEEPPPFPPSLPSPSVPSSFPSLNSPPPPYYYFTPWGSSHGPPQAGRDYSYPYYYFYASKASSLSSFASFSVVQLLSFHVLSFW